MCERCCMLRLLLWRLLPSRGLLCLLSRTPSPGNATQLEMQQQTRAKSKKHSSFSQMWRETGGQRETCSLPVPQLPPCSSHRPDGALLPINLETKLRALEALTKKVSHQISHQCSLEGCGPYMQHCWQELDPSKLSNPHHSSRQKWRSGCGLTLALSVTHRDLHVLPPCVTDFTIPCSSNVDDPAPQTLLETINLTLRALGELLGEFVQAESSSSTCAHCLDYGFFQSCTHFQGRLYHSSQSKHPQEPFFFSW